MKKLLFIALFSIGCFTISNAQFLVYTVTNNSPAVWNYGMADQGSGSTVYELDILPTQVRNGVVSGFGFNLEFKAENSNNCGGYQLVTGAPAAGSVPMICSSFAAFNYSVVEVFPGFLYTLNITFN